MTNYRIHWTMVLTAIIISFACSGCRRKPVEKKSTEDLLQDLAAGDNATKIVAIRQLGLTQNRTAVGALTVALNDLSERVKIAAATALGNSKDPAAAEALWIVTCDPKRGRPLRLAAARALANAGDARAAERLIQALPYAYGEASASLVGLGKLAVPELIHALCVTETRVNASRVLISMGDTGVEALIDLLRHSQVDSERWAAAATLAEIEDPRATDALNQALKKPDPELVSAAYRYIIRRGEPGSEAQLIGVLNTFGKLTMAEDFVASDNAALKAAAQDWARKKSYPMAMRTSEMDVVHWAGVDPSIKRLGLYHFDGSLTSTSGTAPVESRNVSFVPGRWGSALSVGQGGILRYPLAGNLSFKDGTIEMWISPKLDGADPVYSKYNHALLLYHSAGGQFLVSGSSFGGFYAGSVVDRQYKGAGGGNVSKWGLGTWHHIAFTYSSRPARQRFYLDGILAEERNAAMPAPALDASSFTVGCDPYGNWTGFLVDELQITDAEKNPNAIRRSAIRKEPFADH